ncbi:MAG TPA: hypothetical protein ENJ05_09320 [Thiotrichales bacterium]|nr:hypothetical protein [Thiotrichales bacterium]
MRANPSSRRCRCGLIKGLHGLWLCCALGVARAGGPMEGSLWLGVADAWDGMKEQPLALESRHDPLFNRYDFERGISAFTAGLNRKLGRSLSLGAGLAVSPAAPGQVDYRDYFLGLNYRGLAGRVWYQPDPLDGTPAYYYEAGWRGAVSDRFSFSLNLGQRYRRETGFGSLLPDFSVGARASFGSMGLGLRLIEHGGEQLFDPGGLRLMGNVSGSFH